MATSPSYVFKESLEEVDRLLEIHSLLTGDGAGRRHNVEILNKSAILFLCAAFEAFIEDTASRGFDHVITHAKNHAGLPKIALKEIAAHLKEDKNEIRVWDLAGKGWMQVAENYKKSLIKTHIGFFNTPKPHNINELMKGLLGIEEITKGWHWKGMQCSLAEEKLKGFVELRGALAHGEKPSKPIYKADVIAYRNFLAPLSVRTSNDVRKHCLDLTGLKPWPSISYGDIS